MNLRCSFMETGKQSARSRRHIVLVHGLGHGAWCWYKVAAALRAAGHRVTAPDLASCGASPVRVEEVRSLEDYIRPVLRAVSAVPAGEKVVLVGHSYGGHALSLLMQTYPHKIAVAVFVSAFMPPVAGTPMSLLLEQNVKNIKELPPEFKLDNTFGIIESGDDDPIETLVLGPEYLSQRLYQLSPPEDLTLATMLVRPGPMFGKHDAVETGSVLTEDGYGTVRRVYVVTEEDRLFPATDQRRMASMSAGVDVRAVDGADHMAMLSKPVELSELIMEIVDQYS